MRVLVLHNTLNSCGGGERVCLHLCRLLVEHGHEVILATTEPTEWDRVEKLTSINLRGKVREVSLLHTKVRAFGIYMKLASFIHVLKYRRKVDLVINTHGDVLPLPADITYMHFPTIAYSREVLLQGYCKYYRSTFWRLYFEPYRLAEDIFARLESTKSTLLLTNSNYSRYFIKKLFGREAIIVYPPVDVEKYVKLLDKTDREDAVLYIARFSQEKNHHVLIQVAKYLPDVKFYICGSVPGRLAREYFNYCRKLVEKLNVRNVVLLPDIPEQEKMKLLAKCKVYVHMMLTEHFGIAPVEALASGLVPVVSRNSGTWTDVCCFGKFGIAFNSLDPKHIAEKIEEAMNTKLNMAEVREHVKKFSVKTFTEKMKVIIEEFERRNVEP